MTLSLEPLSPLPAPATVVEDGWMQDGAWRGPLARTLDALAPFAPPALVSTAALDAVRAAVRGIPAALTDELYLECRLAADEPRVDLAARVGCEGREVAAGRNPGMDLSPTLLARPAWRRLRGFCAEWADPGSELHRSVAALWLELDVRGAPEDGDTLGVYLDLRWLGERGTPAGAFAALAGAWLERLSGRAPAPAALSSLRRALDALADGAHMIYVGVFPGRGGAVRACASGVAWTALPRYLQAAGWGGDIASVHGLVRALDGSVSSGSVHLDLDGDGPAPRLGVELKLDRYAQLRGRISERALVERLVEAGLCAPEKGEALEAWPGWSEDVLPHQLWPSLVVRRVNHVKLVLEPGRAPEAKAYLHARHTYRRR